MLASLRSSASFFTRPVQVFRTYPITALRPDLLAGLTVAVILLPQAIAYSLIAGLPAQMGLYTAIIGAVVGALWGSSNQLQTGPTNAASLLILITLLGVAAPGTPEYLAAAGLLALLVGIFRLVLGLARLGLLVYFVSDAVIIGFTTGAGIIIISSQLAALLRLEIPSTPGLLETMGGVVINWDRTHWQSLLIGLGVVALIFLLRKFKPGWPGPLIAMISASALAALLGVNNLGIKVIGALPRSLPPLTIPPLFDLNLISQLSSGALALGAIGLIEAISISRAIASQTGQRLDSNQEFAGQGLANIACAFFSGFTCSGSFSRSAMNFRAGARTPMASMFSGLFVLVAMFLLAPLGAYVPRSALAGVLIVTAIDMIDRKEIARIWQEARGGAYGDFLIMLITIIAALTLPLQFAVLSGILVSFAVYILRTSKPRVVSVVPDDEFRHLTYQPDKPLCPQLAIFDILGDLYFGAVSNVEKSIHDYLAKQPTQRFLLLRMNSVNQCDISGIHMLENITRLCRDKGGDLFLVRVQPAVIHIMQTTGFYNQLGPTHVLAEDGAISFLFHRILDPALCIYECEVRVFRECQILPKHNLPALVGKILTEAPTGQVPEVSPQQLWKELRGPQPPLVIDVREPREYQRGHIPQAKLIPLPGLFVDEVELPDLSTSERSIVVVCRGGRRSTRAAYHLIQRGSPNIRVLQGGMLAWESAGLLEAIESGHQNEGES